jgi:class 3 adenylate cyclase
MGPPCRRPFAVTIALLRRAIETHGGYVFKTVGDAFCAVFSRPDDGAQAALFAHAGSWKWPPAGRERLSTRYLSVDQVSGSRIPQRRALPVADPIPLGGLDR